jgi:uncharacterized protein (TIGR02271 family)
MPVYNTPRTSMSMFPFVDLMLNSYAMMIGFQRQVMAPLNQLPAIRRAERSQEIGTTEEQVIPITREELRIGKRQTNRAKVYRVRSTVKEVPVEEQVTLRSETVLIERRPVTTRPAEDDSFREHMLEVRETYEEPVVGKAIVQTEEVVIGKTVTEHTATVRDTVRVTDVEVDEEGQSTELVPVNGQGSRTERRQPHRK